MRRLLLAAIIWLAATSTLAAQEGSREPSRHAFTRANIRLRESPQRDATILAIIPRATLIEVGECDGNWCAVRLRGLDGYASRRYLAFSSPVADVEPAVGQPQGRGYLNSQGEWVPSPQRTADGKVPTGASAHCRDGTYSFSRSRRGTCSHHGGVAEWL